MRSRESSGLRAAVSVLMGLLVLGLGIWLMVSAPYQIENKQYKEIARSLGAFLAASVLVEFLYNITVRPYDDNRLTERLSTLMQREFQRLTKTKGYGLLGIEEELDWAEILSGLPPNCTLWWLDTYDPGHKIWLEPMEEAIARGVSFRMLIMSPQSPMLEHRAEELGEHYRPSTFKRELTGFLDEMRTLARKYPEQIKIVEYDDLPSAPIYVLTKEKKGLLGGTRDVPCQAYSSYFLSEPTGAGFPHLIWKEGESGFMNELFKYVVEKWERNQTHQT